MALTADQLAQNQAVFSEFLPSGGIPRTPDRLAFQTRERAYEPWNVSYISTLAPGVDSSAKPIIPPQTQQPQNTGGGGSSQAPSGDPNAWEGKNEVAGGRLYKFTGGRWVDLGSVDGGGGQPSGPSAEDLLRQEIEGYYGPSMEYLTGSRTKEEEATKGEQKRIEDAFTEYAGRLPGYQKEGEQTIATNERDIQRQNQSAYENAIRAAQGLSQQSLARFGGASSAGGALGEIAGQELARQLGGLGIARTEAGTQIGQQREKLGRFMTEQKNNLEMKKQEALAELSKQSRAVLAGIDNNIRLTKEAKAQLKMQVLQDTVNRARTVEDTNRQMIANIATAAVQQIANIGGETYTPQQVIANIGKYTPQAFQAAQQAVSPFFFQAPGTRKDEISELNPFNPTG